MDERQKIKDADTITQDIEQAKIVRILPLETLQPGKKDKAVNAPAAPSPSPKPEAASAAQSQEQDGLTMLG